MIKLFDLLIPKTKTQVFFFIFVNILLNLFYFGSALALACGIIKYFFF